MNDPLACDNNANSTPSSSSTCVDVYYNVNESYFGRDLLSGRRSTMNENSWNS
jgi:hypothetical protein